MASELGPNWSVNEFFYGTPHMPSQYGFLRDPPANDRPAHKGHHDHGAPKKPVMLQRDISGISDHLDKILEIEVPLCCESCGKKILNAITDMEGVTGVNLDYSAGKVTLRGEVSPKEVLRIIKKIKPKATHRVHAKNVIYNNKPDNRQK